MKNIIYLILIISIQSFAQDMMNETINYDGNLREYSIYVPPSYDGSISVPLLFNFHGGAGDIIGHLYTSDMRPIADTANFIAVYPQALADPNDGYSTNWIHKDPTDHDDVFFIETLIETISSQYTIDQNRIYVCGYSLGAEFTYDLLCRLNNKIASGAGVARTMQQYTYDICAPVHPTAVMTILGTNDLTSPYEGLVWDGESYYVSADDMHAYWSTYNNTDSSPIEIDLPNISSSDGSTVQRRSWINGDNCVSVEELKVHGGGHDWPGSFGNMDINASEEIWNFVSQFNLEGQIGCNYIIEGCTDESALNYISNANQDDGSCYFENSSDLCVANPIQGCMSLAVWDPVCGCDGVTYSNSGDAACNSIYDFTSGECTNISDNACSNISILLSQGWNMIGFSCSENTNALIAFAAIQDKIIIAKDGVGNAYLPDWDFNGIGNLERGYGYLIKVSEEISNYNICE